MSKIKREIKKKIQVIEEFYKSSIHKVFLEKILKYIETKEKECKKLKTENEILKKKLKPKLKNAHCSYFEGQTGLCKAKEFIRCNPVNCESYTIDELSTILELQDKLKTKEQECEKLKKQYNCYACGSCRGREDYRNMARHCENAIRANHKYKQILDEIDKIAHKKRDFDLTGRSTGLLIEICKVAEDFCKIQTLINDIRSNQNGKV